MAGDSIWQAVGGKRPCDGCGRKVRVDEVTVVASSQGKVYCNHPECWQAWVTSLRALA